MNSLASFTTTITQPSVVQKANGGEVIGVGQAVTITITRATKPYLFGLVNLPTYVDGIGSVRALHTIFFWFIGILTLALTSMFVIIERRSNKMVKVQSVKSLAKPNIWLKLGKSIGIGALFALIAFIISNDPSSLALGLLVAYIEFRLL